MKNVCRIVDKETFEIYSLNTQHSLQFVTKANLQQLKNFKFRSIIVSANLSNSSEMRFDNPNYTPLRNSFIFSHRSALQSDDILFSRPVYSDKMRRWTQVWTSRKLIKSVLRENLKKNLRVYFEECGVIPIARKAIWASGNACIEFDNGMYTIKRDMDRPFLEKVSPSLGGFKLDKSNYTSIEDLKVKSTDLLLLSISTCFCLLSFMLFVHERQSTTETVHTHNNKLVELQTLETIQSDLNLGSVKNVEINKSLGTLSIEFITKDYFLSFKKAYEDRPLFKFEDSGLEVTIHVK